MENQLRTSPNATTPPYGIQKGFQAILQIQSLRLVSKGVCALVDSYLGVQMHWVIKLMSPLLLPWHRVKDIHAVTIERIYSSGVLVRAMGLFPSDVMRLHCGPDKENKRLISYRRPHTPVPDWSLKKCKAKIPSWSLWMELRFQRTVQRQLHMRIRIQKMFGVPYSEHCLTPVQAEHIKRSMLREAGLDV
jgi:hypothetical protein